MRNKLTVYLAGAMSGMSKDDYSYWRYYLSDQLYEKAELRDCSLKINNPASYFDFEHEDDYTYNETMIFDLNLLKKSDIVIVNLDHINTSIGTAIELYEATKLNIPVIPISNNKGFDLEEEIENIHPWIKSCFSTRVKHFDKIADFVKFFYM